MDGSGIPQQLRFTVATNNRALGIYRPRKPLRPTESRAVNRSSASMCDEEDSDNNGDGEAVAENGAQNNKKRATSEEDDVLRQT